MRMRRTRSLAAQVRGRLTYANAMSTVAAFAALATGGAYAADKITAKDIAKQAVRSKHVKKNAVKGKHVKDGTLAAADFGDRLPAGPRGPAGPQGPQGPQGPTGAPGEADISGTPAGGDLTGFYPNPTIGGGKVTGAKLAGNSVSSPKIINGTVTNVDLAGNAVNTAKVADNSLAAVDLASSSVRASELGTITVRSGPEVTVPDASTRIASASCNAGERLLSGGVRWSTTPATMAVAQSYPATATTWSAAALNGSLSDKKFRVNVLCLAT